MLRNLHFLNVHMFAALSRYRDVSSSLSVRIFFFIQSTRLDVWSTRAAKLVNVRSSDLVSSIVRTKEQTITLLLHTNRMLM